LIDFAVSVIKFADKLPNSKIGVHIQGQIVRSGSSPAPNYGEAQSAESKQDFIHNIKICLKELRETKIWLKIIKRAELIKQVDLINII
jgi:four helix bundle protein